MERGSPAAVPRGIRMERNGSSRCRVGSARREMARRRQRWYPDGPRWPGAGVASGGLVGPAIAGTNGDGSRFLLRFATARGRGLATRRSWPRSERCQPRRLVLAAGARLHVRLNPQTFVRGELFVEQSLERLPRRTIAHGYACPTAVFARKANHRRHAHGFRQTTDATQISSGVRADESQTPIRLRREHRSIRARVDQERNADPTAVGGGHRAQQDGP